MPCRTLQLGVLSPSVSQARIPFPDPVHSDRDPPLGEALTPGVLESKNSRLPTRFDGSCENTITRGAGALTQSASVGDRTTMEELRQRLWDVAIPLLVEQLVKKYGGEVAPKCLPIAAKILRIEQLTDNRLLEMDDPDSWIEKDLPDILLNLVGPRGVQETAIAVKIGIEGTSCHLFDRFLHNSFNLIIKHSTKTILHQKTNNPTDTTGVDLIERARDIAIDRLFSPLEQAERNLKDSSPNAPDRFAGAPPYGNHFFWDACHSFASYLPDDLTLNNILKCRACDWRTFLIKRFNDRFRDAQDLLQRIEIRTESLDDASGSGKLDLPETVGLGLFVGRLEPIEPSVSPSGTELEANEEERSDLGLQKMVEEASLILLAANPEGRKTNQLALDVYQIHKTAYLNPEHFLDQTVEILGDQLPQLMEEYHNAWDVLNAEYEIIQSTKNKADAALNNLEAEKHFAKEEGFGGAFSEAAEVWGRSLLHAKRPCNPIDLETEDLLRRNIGEIVTQLRSRVNQIGQQFQSDTGGLLTTLAELQDRLLAVCLNYKPYTALEEILESIDWIRTHFSTLVDLETARSKRVRFTVAMRAFQHEERRRQYLRRFDADGNLGRYRARKSYNPAFPQALNDVDSDSLWVRSQKRIKVILAKSGVEKSQSEISDLLSLGGVLILKSIINHAVIKSRLNIFSRGGLLPFVLECFSLFIKRNSIKKYVWEEDFGGSRDCGNRLTQHGQIGNIVWLVKHFPDVEFELKIKNSFSRNEDKIYRRSSRYPENLSVITDFRVRE